MESYSRFAAFYDNLTQNVDYKKLAKFADESDVDITPINAAVWSSEAGGSFQESGNRNSSLYNASFQTKTVEVPLLTVDTLPIAEKVDYIKYDVEGAEVDAILGSRRTIERYRPALAVSLYHRPSDLYEIPLLLHRINPEYRFYLRRKYCLPAWELMLYAV